MHFKYGSLAFWSIPEIQHWLRSFHKDGHVGSSKRGATVVIITQELHKCFAKHPEHRSSRETPTFIHIHTHQSLHQRLETSLLPSSCGLFQHSKGQLATSASPLKGLWSTPASQGNIQSPPKLHLSLMSCARRQAQGILSSRRLG